MASYSFLFARLMVVILGLVLYLVLTSNEKKSNLIAFLSAFGLSCALLMSLIEYSAVMRSETGVVLFVNAISYWLLMVTVLVMCKLHMPYYTNDMKPEPLLSEVFSFKQLGYGCVCLSASVSVVYAVVITAYVAFLAK